MDETLNRRLQIGAASVVVISYFMPWMSIMSPLGTVQLKGLYIDYSWGLLLLSLIHIAAQLALPNREALGIPEAGQKYLTLIHSYIPVVIFAFVAWQGSWFALNVHRVMDGTVFGTEIGVGVKAGLDYGYWLALCGSILLMGAVGMSVKQMPRFVFAAVSIVIITVFVAFVLTRSDKKAATATALPMSPATAAGSDTSVSAAPDFDFSPYIQTLSVKARALDKNYEASRYSDEIVITPIFRNTSPKAIVGVRGRISVIDGFGREVHSFGFRDDDKLAAGAESKHGGGYAFEHNQFENDDPYSKMYALVSANTAKFAVKITNVAFDDGSVVPPTDSANK